MLKAIALLIRLWPVIKPFLPIVLELFRKHQEELKKNHARPFTSEVEDTRDFFQEIERKGEWDPFTPKN